MIGNISAKQKNNVNQIIQLIYFQGAKSIPEISKKINLTIPTVNGLISDLVNRDVLQDQGPGDSSGGRKPSLYGINPEAGYTIILDLNLQYFRIGIYDFQNENISGTKHFDVPLENSVRYIDQVTEKTLQFISVNKIPSEKILGAGIYFPGLVNSEKGLNFSYLNYEGIVVRDVFAEKLKMPVFIENDTRALTIGEFRFGKARSKKNSLMLYVDEGIGLGLILDGKIYHGKSGFSGEFGHIPMYSDGPLCYCGKQGCLETVASGRALIDMITNSIEQGELTHLKKMMSLGDNALSIEMILKAIKLGDQFSIDCISKISEELGKGTSVLLHILNPEMVVVSGKLAEAGKYLLYPFEQAIYKYTLNQITKEIIIVQSELGIKAAMLGMTSVVIENSFKTNGYEI